MSPRQVFQFEVAPGLLVVFYPDTQTVEIASNYELPDRPKKEAPTIYGGPGNVFLPLDLFKELQKVQLP